MSDTSEIFQYRYYEVELNIENGTTFTPAKLLHEDGKKSVLKGTKKDKDCNFLVLQKFHLLQNAGDIAQEYKGEYKDLDPFEPKDKSIKAVIPRLVRYAVDQKSETKFISRAGVQQAHLLPFVNVSFLVTRINGNPKMGMLAKYGDGKFAITAHFDNQTDKNWKELDTVFKGKQNGDIIYCSSQPKDLVSGCYIKENSAKGTTIQVEIKDGITALPEKMQVILSGSPPMKKQNSKGKK